MIEKQKSKRHPDRGAVCFETAGRGAVGFGRTIARLCLALR